MTKPILPSFLFAVLMAVVLAAPRARADAFAVEGTKITAADRGSNDELGLAVDLDADTLIAGAHRNNDNGTHSGSAYLFARNQGGAGAWGQTKKLLASDAASGDEFGYDVAIRGDLAIVGAPFKNGNKGAVYIYDRNYPTSGAWGQVNKLAGASAEEFGFSVDIHGDYCVVGAHLNDTKSGNAGAAYVFQRNGTGTSEWVLVKQLLASDGALNDEFGYDVAIDGDTVAVGSPFDNASDPGSAYVFQRDQAGVGQWGQVKRIVAANISIGDKFGTSVAILGDRIAVGAPFEDTGAGDVGAAYVFERNQGGANQWGQVAQLNATDRAANDHLGAQVAISGELVVAGAVDEDRNSLSSAGAAYLFFRSQGNAVTWGQAGKLTAYDANSNDHFGSAVAVGPVTVMIGALNDNGGAVSSGSVYPYGLLYNDVPTIANQVFGVAENSPNGTEVGTVLASPEDAGQTLVYSITAGNTGGAFAIGANDGLLTVANANQLDYELLFQYSLTIRVVDNGTPPLTNSATATINVADVPETTDVSVTKSASGTGRAGDPLTYSVTVRNNGPLVATNVVVTDTLPAGLTPGGSVVHPLGNMAVGQQQSFSINVTVDSAQTDPLTNRVGATTDTPDSSGANNAFTLVTPIAAVANLGVTQTAPAQVEPGAAFAYTITVTNAGPSDAVNVYGLDTLPPGLTTSGVVSNHLGTLAAGTAQAYPVNVVSDGILFGSLTNHVLVASDTTDPVPADNIAEAETMVNYVADVGIAKTGPVLVTDTDALLYQLVITNYGPSIAADVLVNDTLPPGVTFNPAGSDLRCGSGGAIVECSLGSLTPGAVIVLQVAATLAPTATGTLVNAATVATTSVDGNSGNDFAEAITVLSDFDQDGQADFADPDDDNDQIPDDWEIANGLNRYADDAGDDPDTDGYSNVEEYIADTVPTNGLSYLALDGIEPAALLYFTSSSNRLYSLEYTDDLPADAWSTVPGQTNLPGVGGLQIILNTNADPVRHYRIRAHLP